MNKKIGFIGAGNMGSAILKSVVKSKKFFAKDINIFDLDKEKVNDLCDETGVNSAESVDQLVDASDIIILAVKPNVVEKVLTGCKNRFNLNKMLISIAVGIPISTYKNILGADKKIIRTMPNTPALVGEGMTLISFDDNINDNDLGLVKAIFECTGKVEVLEEKFMNEVTALTGSSPAYVFMFIEAMADAAVLSGLPRNLSYKLAAQAVLGSAKMVLESGKHPGELKDQVCSPGGTTIEAVAALEKNGFRHAVIDAMNQCTDKARSIGKG